MKKLLSVLLAIAMIASACLAVVPAFAEGEEEQQTPANYVTNATHIIPSAASGLGILTKPFELTDVAVAAEADFKFSASMVFDELGTDWQQASVILWFSDGSAVYVRMARNGDNDKARFVFQTVSATSEWSAEKIIENVSIDVDNAGLNLTAQRKKGALTLTFTDDNSKELGKFACNDLLNDFDYTLAVTAVTLNPEVATNYHFQNLSLYTNNVTKNTFAYVDSTSNYTFGPINTVEIKTTSSNWGDWVETAVNAVEANFDFTWSCDIAYADMAAAGNAAFWVNISNLEILVRVQKNANSQVWVGVQTYKGGNWSATSQCDWTAIDCNQINFAFTRDCAANSITVAITDPNTQIENSDGEKVDKPIASVTHKLEGDDYTGKLTVFKLATENNTFANVTFKHCQVVDTGLRDADYTAELRVDGTSPNVALGVDATFKVDITLAAGQDYTLTPSFDFYDAKGAHFWNFQRFYIKQSTHTISNVAQINDGGWSDNYTMFNETLPETTSKIHLEIFRDATNNKLVWTITDADTSTVIVDHAEYKMDTDVIMGGKQTTMDVTGDFTYFRIGCESGNAGTLVYDNCFINAVASKTTDEFDLDINETTAVTITETHNHFFTNEVAEDAYLCSAATTEAKATYYYSCSCGAHSEKTFAYGELAKDVNNFEVDLTAAKAGWVETTNVGCGEDVDFTWSTTVTMLADKEQHAQLWIDFDGTAGFMRIRRNADNTYNFYTQAYCHNNWGTQNELLNQSLPYNSNKFNLAITRTDGILTLTISCGDYSQTMAFALPDGENLSTTCYRVKYGDEGKALGYTFTNNKFTYALDAETTKTVTNFKFSGDAMTVVETPIEDGVQPAGYKTTLVAASTGWKLIEPTNLTADEAQDFTFSFDVTYDPSVEGSRGSGIWIDIGSVGIFSRFIRNEDGTFRFTGQIYDGANWLGEENFENVEFECNQVMHVVVERKGSVVTIKYQDDIVVEYTNDFHGGSVDLSKELWRIKFLNENGVAGYTINNLVLVKDGTAYTDFSYTGGDTTCFTYYKVPYYATTTVNIGGKGPWAEWNESESEEENWALKANIDTEFSYDMVFTNDEDDSSNNIDGTVWWNFSGNTGFYYRIQHRYSGGTWTLSITLQYHINNPDSWSDNFVVMTIADANASMYHISQKKFAESGMMIFTVSDATGKIVAQETFGCTQKVSGEDYDFDISGGTDIIRFATEAGTDVLYENIKFTTVNEEYSDFTFTKSNVHTFYTAEWTEWVKTQDPTCGVAGKVTRTDNVSLKVEEATIAPTGEHTFGDWVETTAPDCTTKGQKQRTCSVCGEVEKKSVQALGHDYADAEWTIDVAATETSKGSKSQHCKVCGTPCNVTEIPKLEPTTTTADDSTDAPSEEPTEKKGCGSTLGVSALALVLVSTLGMGLKRKH